MPVRTPRIRTALLASYDKDDALVRLGTLLSEHGWTLLGSSGTATYLAEHGIRCQDVTGIVGAPILGHRVVTLSRELSAGLLATNADEADLARLSIPWIDLVYVTFYPLEQTIADPASTPENILEKTDIGGPTLLRAAAKGRRIALSSPAQIDELEAWMKSGEDANAGFKLVLKFAAAAERKVADYVAASASYWEKQLQK
ncbi:MAG: phosphoribosylaminoimidazolecarboxamide formyltransferase/IMP cyclohydrolase [Candidatus Parcubacteria bacterium]|jgi:phosphoribosylaminoimidazolecarboxamide formyltransferase/IMP cyclohydrolase